MTIEKRTALLVGATGLVGKELLHILLASDTYEKVIIFVRKSLALDNEKLTEFVIDFDELASYEEAHKVDDVFCCLGTTIKKAGSEEAFKLVDYTYPVEIAQLAKKHGAEQYFLISAIGADSSSRIFYNRVKGEVEAALQAIDFPSLHVFHPSLLLGDRGEFRLGEKLADVFSPVYSPLLRGKLTKYKPVQGKVVAESMYQAALTGVRGMSCYELSKETGALSRVKE